MLAQLEPLPHYLVARSRHLEIFLVLLHRLFPWVNHVELAPSGVLLNHFDDHELLVRVKVSASNLRDLFNCAYLRRGSLVVVCFRNCLLVVPVMSDVVDVFVIFVFVHQLRDLFGKIFTHGVLVG